MVDTPRGQAASMRALSPYETNITVNYDASLGIVRGSGADWFGPLNPMAPTAPPEVAGRAFNFIPGFNLNTRPRTNDRVNFETMRALADSYDLMRLVIETRKDQITKTKWKIRAKPDADPRTKDVTTPEQQERINYLTTFFERPDGVKKWRPWLRSLLEDKFVIDAVTLYKRRNRGGNLIALEQLDGATIKPVIDDWGRTPQPYWLGGEVFYPPAYQQWLAGLPAVNYSTRDIVYRPYNTRVSKVYGYSEVEQVMTTVNIAMRRQNFQLSYYTEGNIPEALIGTPDGWTPEQIVAFQTAWDAMFTGNNAQRRHAKFVPGGIAKTFIPTKEPDLKNPMDDWLARIVCFAFSVSPQQLVTMMNRATAQTGAEQAKEEGNEPLKEFVKEIIDDVIEADFMSPDLEMAWDDEIVVDEQKQVEIIKAKKDAGLISVNRAREMIGEENSTEPGAEALMVMTGTGMVPIGANTMEGKQAAIDAGLAPDPTVVPEPFGGGGGNPDASGNPKKPSGDKPAPGKDDKKEPPPDARDAKAQKIARARNVMGVFKASGVIEPVPFPFRQSRNAE